LTGILLPFNIQNICKIFESTQEDFEIFITCEEEGKFEEEKVFQSHYLNGKYKTKYKRE
jgi:hypothetical protein